MSTFKLLAKFANPTQYVFMGSLIRHSFAKTIKTLPATVNMKSHTRPSAGAASSLGRTFRPAPGSCVHPQFKKSDFGPRPAQHSYQAQTPSAVR
jgi:hypothetical protein